MTEEKHRDAARGVIRGIRLKAKESKLGIAGTTQRLGKNRAYFNHREEAGNMGIVQILQALDAVEVKPGDFFDEVFSSAGFETRLRLKMSRDSQKLKGHSLPISVRRPSSKEVEPQLLPPDEFERLDLMRAEDPKLALSETLDVVTLGLGSDRPRWLGLLGSCYRSAGDWKRAHRSIWIAMEEARELGQSKVLGELNRRMAYVYLGEGIDEMALDLCRRALAKHAQALDLLGLARGCIDTAMVLYHREDHDESLKLYRMAACLAGNEDWRVELASAQGIAANLCEIGETEEGLRYLELARRFDVPQGVSVSLDWLEGRLALRLNRHEWAIRNLSKVVEHLIDHGTTFNLSLATCDLICALWCSGQIAEATNVAIGGARLLSKFQDNKLAVGAVRELVVAASAGKISRSLVQRVRGQLERASKRRARSSLI